MTTEEEGAAIRRATEAIRRASVDDQVNPGVPRELHQRDRYRHAAAAARRAYPGVVGDVLASELLSYAEFGWLLGSSAQIERLARHVLVQPAAAVAAIEAAA